MTPDQLPSPGKLVGAEELRRLCARMISRVQVNAAGNTTVPGTHSTATELDAFFAACSDELTAYKPV